MHRRIDSLPGGSTDRDERVFAGWQLRLEILVQIHRPVEDADDVDFVRGRTQIDDTVVAPQQDASLELWIRRAISSFEIVLPAFESAIPRSTIVAKASSLMISSEELSSG